MEHIKNTIKLLFILTYFIITITNMGLTCLGGQLFMIEECGYSPIFISILIFIINLFLLKHSKEWLKFMNTYFDEIFLI